MQEELYSCVASFLDSLPLFRYEQKGLGSFRQEYVNKYFMDKQNYEAQNIIADVTALKQLVKAVCINQETYIKIFIQLKIYQRGDFF